jgi:hypothetical protein
MAGRGPVPKPTTQRRTRHKPQRGEWQATPGIGWQHGPIPEPPDGLLPASEAAWQAWMASWWAANWYPGDLPFLWLVIKLFDAVEQGWAGAALRTELRQLMDNAGISPKGRQDRRWQPPKADVEPASKQATSRYSGLRVVAQ